LGALMKLLYTDIYYSWQSFCDDIIELEDQFGGDAWDGDSIFEELQDSNLVFGVLDDKKLVGYVATKSESDHEYIWTFVVNPEYKGKGVGKQLLQSLLRPHEKYRLDVRMDNYGAIKIYDELGFKIVDSQEEFYFDGCPSLTFEK